VAHPSSGSTAVVVEWEATGPRTVVRISGDLDSVTEQQVEAYVARRSLAGCHLLEIDLEGVPSIGSVGASVLLGVRHWTLQRGIEFRIRGAQPSVWRVFEVTGLDGLFAAATDPVIPAAAQDLALF
jgi:anti-anti-sigma factor